MVGGALCCTDQSLHELPEGSPARAAFEQGVVDGVTLTLRATNVAHRGVRITALRGGSVFADYEIDVLRDQGAQSVDARRQRDRGRRQRDRRF